jgi:hypothetical protein
MRHVTSRPLENVLFVAQIIPTIGGHRVARLVNIRHCESRGLPSVILERGRRIVVEPLDVFLTGVGRLQINRIESVPVLGHESHPVTGKPQVMDGGSAKPLAARMIGIQFLVAAVCCPFPTGSRRQGRRVSGVMARVKQLAGFQQHLDDVLVDGVPGCFSRTPVKKEDVHSERKERGKEGNGGKS